MANSRRPMKHRVQFITLEEDDKDLIVAFAIDASEDDIRSLILLRTLFFEEVLPEYERGVKVSMEGEEYEDDDRNIMVSIEIDGSDVVIESTSKKYRLDISKIDRADVKGMIQLLEKQNHDRRFTMRVK